MRDEGLRLAIEAAGGVAALARCLEISQPSVSGWSRIPAERVLAVEAVTGVHREQLRPDLYRASTVGTGSHNDNDAPVAVDEIDVARARQYLLLAALLRSPPKRALLDQVAALTGDASPLGLAMISLAQAARGAGESKAGEEYFRLFVGVGRGELMPYGSYYMTGFLHERPLARVREDLVRLGIERSAGVFEPEDHIATELETMAGLLEGSFGVPAEEAQVFFMRHLKPWAPRFFADLALVDGAPFYRSVGELGGLWMDIETEAYKLPQ